MKKVIRLTESDLSKIIKKIIKETYTMQPDIEGAKETMFRGKGYSHIGTEENNNKEFYIVFDGEKFYEDDLEFADYNDLGDLPRVEDGKLIIANPAWKQ